jgi:hypothetical protein
VRGKLLWLACARRTGLFRYAVCAVFLLASSISAAQTPAALNTADLQLYTNGRVLAAVRLADGSVVFAGNFSRVNGVARPNIAKLNSDGGLDTTWNPPINSYFTIGSLAADHTGYVYVGYLSGYIEKLSTSGAGARDPAWHSPGSSRITALVVDSSNDLFASGDLSTDASAYRTVLKVSATGQIDPTWNPAFSARVKSLAIDSGDNLYAGGDFATVGGIPRLHLAKVSTTGAGTVDPNWNPSAQAVAGEPTLVPALTADNQGSLYVGGQFATIGGQSRNNLAKLTTTGSGLADPSWNPSPNGGVNALLADGLGSIYVGGAFTSIGGNANANCIARLSALDTGAADASWGVSIDNLGSNYVSAIAFSGNGNIAFGGFFSLVSGQPRHSVAVVTTSAGAVGAAVDAIYQGGTVNAMAAQSDGGLIVGGYFSGAGNLIRSNLLRLRPDGTVDPEWSADTDAPNSLGVETVIANNDAIYIGGEFTKVGGRPKVGIAKLSTTGTPDASWGAATDATGGYYGVQALSLAPNGSVYLGGDFLTVGGQARIGLARVSSSGVFDTLWNSGANFDADSVSFDRGGGIGAIAVDQDGAIYTSHNDADCGLCLRKYSPDDVGAVDSNWHGAYYGQLYALKLDGHGYIFVASAGGLTKLSSADGSSAWSTSYYYSELTLANVSSRNVASGVPYAIALDDVGDVFAGGGFIQIAGRSRPFLAKLSADTGAADPDWNPEADNAVLALESDGKGNLYVGGTFTQLGNKSLTSFGVVPQTTSGQGVPDNLNQFGWTGAWYNPSTSGQGIMLYTIPGTGSDAGTIFGGWFTFSPDSPGKNRWYSLQGPIDRSSKSAALTEFVTYQNSQYYGVAYAGDALLTFSDCNHATLTYQLYDPYTPPQPYSLPTLGEPVAAGTTDLVRLSSNVLCTPNGDRGDPGDFANSGAWYDSANAPDSGLLFDVDANLGVFFAAWYVSDPYSHQIFNPEIVSNSWYTLQAPFHSGMSSLAAVPIFQISGGKLDYPGPVTRSQVGTADFTFINCNAVTMTYTFTAGASAGNQGTLNLTRGAGKPASCNP